MPLVTWGLQTGPVQLPVLHSPLFSKPHTLKLSLSQCPFPWCPSTLFPAPPTSSPPYTHDTLFFFSHWTSWNNIPHSWPLFSHLFLNPRATIFHPVETLWTFLSKIAEYQRDKSLSPHLFLYLALLLFAEPSLQSVFLQRGSSFCFSLPHSSFWPCRILHLGICTDFLYHSQWLHWAHGFNNQLNIYSESPKSVVLA